MLAVAAFLAVLAPAPDQWAVAYSARYYFQDKRKSYTQIYLSTLDGKKRKAITDSKIEKGAVAWLGHNKLAWVEGETDDRLMEYNLATGKSRLVAKLKTPETYISFESLDRRDGTARFIFGDEPFTFLGGPKGWQKLKRNPEQEWSQPNGETYVPYSDEGKVTLAPGVVLAPNEEEIEEGGYDLTVGEKSFKLKGIEGRLLGLIPSKEPNFSYFRAGNVGASAGSEEFIYKVDLTTGKLTTLVKGKCQIDFLPTSPLWAALDGYRPMTTLKDGKSVWATRAWVGDTRTGKSWIIAPNPVFVGAVALRPE